MSDGSNGEIGEYTVNGELWRLFEGFFADFAAEIVEGNLERAAERFNIPSAMYFQGSTRTHETKASVARSLAAFHVPLKEAGMASAKSEILAISLTRSDNRTIWKKWSFLNHAGDEIGTTKSRHHCVLRGNLLPKIHMSELLHLDFTQQGKPKVSPKTLFSLP